MFSGSVKIYLSIEFVQSDQHQFVIFSKCPISDEVREQRLVVECITIWKNFAILLISKVASKAITTGFSAAVFMLTSFKPFIAK
jgi:hypothetical protein